MLQLTFLGTSLGGNSTKVRNVSVFALEFDQDNKGYFLDCDNVVEKL